MNLANKLTMSRVIVIPLFLVVLLPQSFGLPESVSFVQSASLGCRFATAYRAVVLQAAVRPGEFVAVHGCGGVGACSARAAHCLRV